MTRSMNKNYLSLLCISILQQVLVNFICCKTSFLSTSIFIENPAEESLSKILCISLRHAWSFHGSNTLKLLLETSLCQGHTQLFSSFQEHFVHIKALHVKKLLQISASCSVRLDAFSVGLGFLQWKRLLSDTKHMN